MNIKKSGEPCISFHQHEKRDITNIKNKDPPLHIVDKINEKMFKMVLVDEG